MSASLVQSITFEDLSQLVEIFHGYEQALETSFLHKKLQNGYSSTQSDQLKDACTYIHQRQEQDKDLLKRMIDVLKGMKASLGVDKERARASDLKAQGLQQQVDRFRAQIGYLEETIEAQARENQQTRKRLVEAEDRLEQVRLNKQKQEYKNIKHESQKAEVVETHLDFESQIKSLKEENSELMASLELYKRQIILMQADLQQMHARNATLEDRISGLQTSVCKSQQRKSSMEKDISEKEGLIVTLKSKLQRRESRSRTQGKIMRESFGRSVMDIESVSGQPVNLNEQFTENRITTEDQPLFSYRDMRHSDSMREMDTVIHSNRQSMLGQSQVEIRPFQQYHHTEPFDPYFIHYVLSCQTVRIQISQEGGRQNLPVDMTSRYKDILDNKIPIHEWGNWIRKTLLKSVGHK